MRPICRGESPRNEDFENYREALPELISRLGPYCSYCERRISTNLHVEHIQPKAKDRNPELEGRWDNFLLACVNCNSTKKDKAVQLDRVFIVDRDNTSYAFSYTEDGEVLVSECLTESHRRIAKDTLALMGLEKVPLEIHDSNARLVAIDRVAQRKETWLLAIDSKQNLADVPSDVVRNLILRAALASGHFSLWMTVYFDDAFMLRQALINAFPGTAAECFDATTQMVSPRSQNTALQHSGKI